MQKLCWFDADGNLINIGEWEYQYQSVVVGTEDIEVDVPDDYELQPDEEWLDETEGAKKIKRIEYVFDNQILNPIPGGAYSEMCEVCQAEDGSWVPADDYVTLRRASYPPYSVWDVLDEVLKHITPEPGSKLEQIQTERLSVKAQYPKPEVE